MMGLKFSRTFGVQQMLLGVEKQTMRDALRAMIKGADKMVARTKQKLSVRGDGPSRPGQPPAMHEGMLVDAIGRTEGSGVGGAVGVAWGFGVGQKAVAAMQRHAARRGETLGDMFAIGNMNEFGSVNYDLARSHPKRPFIRTTEEEMKDEVVADIERAMGVR